MLIGYLLEIKEINPAQMLNACIESVINTEPLENPLLKCLKKIQ